MIEKEVKSSNISSIGYIYEEKKLIVKFKTGGIYEYQNVDSNIYESLISAPSVGSYFHKNIKNKYNYIKKEK